MPLSSQQYADAFASPLQPLLKSLLEHTENLHPKAHMISGHTQGMLLQCISHMVQPKAILEIGTFTGFSALCMAEGLASNGNLHTIEIRPDDAATAQSFFDRSPHCQRIHLHLGDAHKIIPSLTTPWDLVFIDADKTSYIDYYEMIVPQMRTGGWLLADNVLFHGEVLQDNIKGKNAKAIAAFNEHVRNDTRTSQVLLTVRDGLLLVQKR